MSGGNEDARNTMGAERILGLVAAAVGCVDQAINLFGKYSKLEETRNMNAHIKLKDFLNYQMAKQTAKHAKQAADKPVS